MRLPLLLLAAVSLALPAHAGLTWAEKSLTLKARPGSDVVEARYRFTNAGPSAVDIQQVESSCGCTTAELEKRHYEPGEGGEIIARFTIGARVGEQTKTIAVKTQGAEEPTTLTMVVEIPEIIRIRPTFVYWVQGEAGKPKTMTLEVQPETPVEKITVQSSRPEMKPVLKEIVKGLRYELTVTPAKTDQVLFSLLALNCDFGKAGGGAKSLRAYATVKPAGAEPQ